jgi:hypothetical protein
VVTEHTDRGKQERHDQDLDPVLATIYDFPNRIHGLRFYPPPRIEPVTGLSAPHRVVETDSAMGTVIGGRRHSSKDWLQQHSATAGTSGQHSHQRSNRQHHDDPKYEDHEEDYQWQPCKADAATDQENSPNKLNPTSQRSPLFDVLSDRHDLPRHRLI